MLYPDSPGSRHTGPLLGEGVYSLTKVTCVHYHVGLQHGCRASVHGWASLCGGPDDAVVIHRDDVLDDVLQ